MKKLLIFVATASFVLSARAQKLEISLQGNSTFAHFRGTSAVSESYIQESYAGPDSNKTGNPYGKKYATGFNIGAQAQIITRSGFIAGFSTGYELFRSRVNITSVVPAQYFAGWFTATNYTIISYPATGTVSLNSSYINLSPYVGYRFKIQSLNIDLLPGAEFAINTSVKEKGQANATYNDKEFATTYPRKKLPVDTRLKFGINAGYKKFSVNVDYSRGLRNYNRDVISPNQEPTVIKTELFRLGLGYRIL